MREVTEISEAEIVSAYASHTLTEKIFSGRLKADKLRELCIKLHNRGEIDLLSLTDQSSFLEIDGRRFFSGQQFFCGAIPELNASVDDVMRCVQNLVTKGGQDGAAGLPNLAFQSWCKRDLSRALEIIAEARAGKSPAINFVTFALTAGDMVKEALKFATGFTDGRRLSAITALGRMKYSDSAVARTVLSSLVSIASSDSDDNLLGHVLHAATGIAGKPDVATSVEFHAVLERVCGSPGGSVHYFCAGALFDLAKTLSNDAVLLLMHALESLNPTHKGTVEHLDIALMRMLGTRHADQAINLVTILLSSAKSVLTLADFDSFGRELIKLPPSQFGPTFARWMLTGEHVHREGLSQLLRQADRDEQPLDLLIAHLKLSDGELVFLCRKTIGYFFLQPIVAGSVLIAVLRSCSEQVAEEVTNLLFDPLLLNFGSKLTDYLKSIPENDSASVHIKKALERKKTYLDDLRDLKAIRELCPSEHQRQMERTRLHEEMQAAHKKAESNSVFMNFMSKINLLHGRRAVTYVQEPDGGHRWVEIELKGLSVQIEMPRMETLDTVGLEFKLTIFRIERLRS